MRREGYDGRSVRSMDVDREINGDVTWRALDRT
jgi:hypothetical protein